jgi:hypothetical protein
MWECDFSFRPGSSGDQLMASGKKRRKQVKLDRQARRTPTGVFRHRDGDRRRRYPTAEAIATKKARQQGLLPPLPPEPGGE